MMIIKKGERIPEEYLKFFADEIIINDLVTAGVDIFIKNERNAVNIKPVNPIPENGCCIRLENNDINGAISNKPFLIIHQWDGKSLD